jgi:Divergent InlB B-repeat domain
MTGTMRRLALLRFAPRLALLLAGCLSLAMVAALTTRADSHGVTANRAVTKHPTSRWAAAVALALPSTGDVSYGVVRVRLARGARLVLPGGMAGQTRIFSGRLGGLEVSAKAGSWRALRRTTRAYVVVAAVPGAGPSVRDVALFVVRRKTRGGPAAGRVTFTIANARPVVGSFWVHALDRHGYADVFKARNILSTALANWARYVRVLQAADAMRAATRPLILGSSQTATASTAGKPLPGPWAGGQRPDARVLAMYRLLISELRDPYGWGALKLSPVVPQFITTELGNPALATRWRTVVAKVPVHVPDRYAALAQEEKRFTQVTSPLISHLRVADTVNHNSGSEAGGDTGPTAVPGAENLTVDVTGMAGASVDVYQRNQNQTETLAGTCSSRCLYSWPTTPDGQGHATPTVPSVFLIPHGPSNTVVSGWGDPACTLDGGWGTCTLSMSSGDYSVSPQFVPSRHLNVAVSGDSGTVTVSGPGDSCSSGTSCTDDLPTGSTVTLTAFVAQSSEVVAWTGCGQVSADTRTCTLTLNQDTNVAATIGYPLGVSVQTFDPQHTGYVTSDVGGINCGAVPSGSPSCSATLGSGTKVTLTAHPVGGVFEVWQGCDQSVYTTCTVTMNPAKNVTAIFR